MIKTKRLIIKPIKKEDVSDVYLKNLNDKEYMEFMDFQNQIHTRDSIIEYIEKSNINELEKLYGIFIKETGEHVGNIRLTRWHKEFKKIELGILIFKEYSGKGIGTEAIKELVKYTFENFSIKKISVGVYEHNIASYRMFTTAGFSKEGFEKYHSFINGKFMHRFVLAIYNKKIQENGSRI